MISILEKKFSIFKTLPISCLLCIFMGILIFIAPLSSAFAANSKITVMTRNLYLGADIFRVVDVANTPALIPGAVADVYNMMISTDFSARAEGIADEIAANKPQVVGLNEVETFYRYKVNGGTDIIDFYTILNAALKKRGMDYQAFSNENANITLPMGKGYPPYDYVQMIDHDYILVQKGNLATSVLAKHYIYNLGLQTALGVLTFNRGYLIVDVNVNGEDYRIACTHPEVRSAVGSVYRFYQSAQMNELIGTLNALSISDPKPIIMVGDFNSSPEDVPGIYNDPKYGQLPYIPPYMQAVTAGYLDSWLLQTKHHDAGYTDGFSECVCNLDDTLTSRIDLIFLDLLDLRVDRVKCDIVGKNVSDMVPNPLYPGQYLWPSDHAGLVSDMQFKVPK